MTSNAMLDDDPPGTVRLTESQARAIAMRALDRCGYDATGAAIITDQLVDNALCGYKFASLARILTIAEVAGNRYTSIVDSPDSRKRACNAPDTRMNMAIRVSDIAPRFQFPAGTSVAQGDGHDGRVGTLYRTSSRMICAS